jgi:hypothetical protein
MDAGVSFETDIMIYLYLIEKGDFAGGTRRSINKTFTNSSSSQATILKTPFADCRIIVGPFLPAEDQYYGDAGRVTCICESPIIYQETPSYGHVC